MTNDTPETKTAVEDIKPSRLKKLAHHARTVGILAIPGALTVGGSLLSAKVAKMNYDTAKLNLAVATAKAAANTIEKS